VSLVRIESSWLVEEGVVTRIGPPRAAKRPGMPLQPRWRVLRLVQLGMTRPAQIAKRLGLTPLAVRQHLAALKRAGKVQRTGLAWVPRC